jgi:hypothetical protein
MHTSPPGYCFRIDLRKSCSVDVLHVPAGTWLPVGVSLFKPLMFDMMVMLVSMFMVLMIFMLQSFFRLYRKFVELMGMLFMFFRMNIVPLFGPGRGGFYRLRVFKSCWRMNKR